MRCSEFASQPSDRFRFERVRRNDADLRVIASGAFEQPVLEAYGSRRHAFQHHPRLAMETARALNRGQKLLGRGHEASLH
jgi:hypothetical protein